MQIGQRMGRTPRDKQVHRQQGVQAFGDFRTPPEGATCQGTTAHGNHNFRIRHGFVCLQKGRFHIPRNGTGHHNTIGVTGGCHKVDAEPGKVEKGRCQHI